MNLKVKNRSGSTVIYNILEDKLRREFSPGEIKEVPEEELMKLTYQPGGKKLLQDYLLINDKESAEELGIKIEPEYWLTEAEVVNLLKNGSLDSLLDCIDFAPVGVLEMIKYYAVQLPLNDVQKRNAIKEKMSFDVDAAVKNNIESKKDSETETEKERRVKISNDSTSQERRTSPTNYKVVSK